MPDANWQDLLMDAVVGGGTHRTRRSIGVNFTPDLQRIVLASARERDMSLTAFARRSALAIATFDQGLDWLEVMRNEPRLRGFGQISEDPQSSRGLGHGAWKIVALEDFRG